MNKEIKEILDKLKDDSWYDKLDLTGDKWIELKQTETKSLLYYITNLQQEIEEANDSIIWWANRFKTVRKENEKLQERFDNLMEAHKICDKGNEKFQQENVALKEELAITQEKWDKDRQFSKGRLLEIKDYKTRIDKAVAKINNIFDEGNEKTIIDDLLELDNILQGEKGNE